MLCGVLVRRHAGPPQDETPLASRQTRRMPRPSALIFFRSAPPPSLFLLDQMMNLFYTHAMSAPHEGIQSHGLSRQERREKAWEHAHVLFLETGDQDFFPGPESIRDVYDTLVEAQRFLRKLTEQSTLLIQTGKLERRRARSLPEMDALVRLPDFQRRIFSLAEATLLTPHRLGIEIQRHRPSCSFSLIEGNSKHELNIPHLSERLKQNPRPQIVSVSDSHRTTADMFRAMRLADWKYPPSQAAILSFDHHTDTHPGPDSEPHKANVMRWLLEKKYINALGVIGVKNTAVLEAVPGASFIRGSQLYDEYNHPKRALFQSELDYLLTQWQRRGIQNIYLSVDLDGLCLDTSGITSTDYSPDRGYWTGIKVLSRLEKLAFAPNLAPEVSRNVWQSIGFALDELRPKTEPYHGIPAAWILHAVQIAKDPPFEFNIGIRDALTGKTVIGDITEVSGVDRRRHGSRMTMALLDAIVKETAK